MNLIQAQQLHLQNYNISQRPVSYQGINYLLINSPAKDQFVRQNTVAFEGKSAQKTEDLSGQWEYFLGDELPQAGKSPTGKMNLPSNWFLLGKKNSLLNLKSMKQNLLIYIQTKNLIPIKV